jgi:hypothetical protein
MTETNQTQNEEQTQSIDQIVEELIRENNHPALHIIIRALQHVRSKIESGADVTIRLGDDAPYLEVVTRKAILLIEQIVTNDGKSKLRIYFGKTGKTIATTVITMKQYLAPYDESKAKDLIYSIWDAIRNGFEYGIYAFDDRIPRIIDYVKDIIKHEENAF